MDGPPHGVKYEIDAFSPSQLGCGHKVGITRHKHDLRYLSLVRKGCNIKTYTHIHTFLAGGIMEICVYEIGKLLLTA